MGFRLFTGRACFLFFCLNYMDGWVPAGVLETTEYYLLHVNHNSGRVFQVGRFGFWRDYSVQSMYVGGRVCLDGRNLLQDNLLQGIHDDDARHTVQSVHTRPGSYSNTNSYMSLISGRRHEPSSHIMYTSDTRDTV